MAIQIQKNQSNLGIESCISKEFSSNLPALAGGARNKKIGAGRAAGLCQRVKAGSIGRPVRRGPTDEGTPMEESRGYF